jgi:membrane protein implicated in regulation of membrane protease activity
MNPVRVLSSIYNFLCGDIFIFVMTLAAFGVGGVLVSVVQAPEVVAVIVFVGLVVSGLVLTLGRERRAGQS